MSTLRLKNNSPEHECTYALRKKSLDKLGVLLENTSQDIDKLPIIGSSFWEKGSLIFNISNTFWYEKTNHALPGIPLGFKVKTFLKRTHPAYVVNEDETSVTVCFCTSKENKTCDFIPKGSKLDRTGYIVKTNTYVIGGNAQVHFFRGFKFHNVPRFAGTWPITKLEKTK